MTSLRLFAFALMLPLAAGAAHALDIKAVGVNPMIMYDAPSERGRKVFVAPRGMPVEVVLTYGEWSKVRDVAGDLLWVESKALTARRNVVVKAMSTKVHAAADDNTQVVFSADHGVLLELLDPPASGWLKVKHRDGLTGYVKAVDVWGD